MQLENSYTVGIQTQQLHAAACMTSSSFVRQKLGAPFTDPVPLVNLAYAEHPIPDSAYTEVQLHQPDSSKAIRRNKLCTCQAHQTALCLRKCAVLAKACCLSHLLAAHRQKPSCSSSIMTTRLCIQPGHLPEECPSTYHNVLAGAWY